jgi:hypothetical protein
MLATWLHPGASHKNTKKMNFQPILNIELFLTHIKLELGVLGIIGKLVNDVVHLWRQNFGNIIVFFFIYIKEKLHTVAIGREDKGLAN